MKEKIKLIEKEKELKIYIKEPIEKEYEIVIKNSKARFIVYVLTKINSKLEFNMEIENSEVEIYLFSEGSFDVNINGNSKDSKVNIYWITIPKNVRKYVKFYGKNSKITIKDKNLLVNNSTIGLNFLVKGEKNSDVSINSLGILLGKNVSVSGTPSLEIEDNTTNAEHSFSIVQLDRKKIEYLMTRGLTERKAKYLLISSILTEEKYFKKEVLDYLDKIL